MKASDAVLILIGAVVIAVSAQISYDLILTETVTIPLTGQSLAVIVLSLLLKRSVGTFMILTYLLAGAIGLPVFADGAAGIGHLYGATAGYLLGFVLVPQIIGRGGRYQWLTSWSRLFVANLIGTLIILLCGILVLATKVGLDRAYDLGMEPFYLAGILKSLIGAAIVIVVLKIRPLR